MTIHDGLTGVPNRRHFEDFLERELARALRYDRPLSLMLFDIDHFKKTNDTFGHLAGDFVLRRLASVVNQTIRREELIARYGGEEFVVVMPETRITEARKFAERLRQLVAGTDFEFDERKIVVTISVGVACLAHGLTRDQFIHLADQALYQAKANGRNQVCCAPNSATDSAPDAK
jgi:diguanylate cyclase (GGDEF)-like protein